MTLSDLVLYDISCYVNKNIPILNITDQQCTSYRKRKGLFPLKKKQMTTTTCVVIPALNPPEKFYDHLKALSKIENLFLLIVNDGSDSQYHQLFSDISKFPCCTVLTHQRNKGKGAALKTAFSYLSSHGKQSAQIVCADCDGQHSIKDILRLAEEGSACPGALILGERQFSGAAIPWKSKLGNQVSSLLFYLSGGIWLRDTQTGLRSFHCSLLPVLLSIPGNRFEYETRVLVHCLEHHYPLRRVKIDTIYENGNKSTHFRPVQDSFQVLAALLRSPAKFLASSLVCAGFDLLLFSLLCRFLSEIPDVSASMSVIASTVLARICSTGLNYLINKNYVFASRNNSDSKGSANLRRYLLLCVSVMLLSGISVSFFSFLLSVSREIMKILTDSILFLVSYLIQKKWVFSESGTANET